MSFAFTPEQEELRSSAARLLEDKSSSDQVRELMETDGGFDEGTWKQIADLGWCGMAIPEDVGGIGFGTMELVVLLEEMGKRLFCAPFLSSVVLAANAILEAGTGEQKAEHLPGVADGTTRATLAFVEASGRWDADGIALEATRDGDAWSLTGQKWYVLDATTATLLVVAARTPGGISLFTVDPDAGGVQRRKLTTLDMTRKQGVVTFDGTPARLLGEEGSGGPALATTLDRAAALLAAEMVGGAQACLDDATDYAKERYQFGRPIGSFQAIKHKLADMMIEVENARSAAYYAGWAAAEDPEELPIAASMAKAYCSDAFFHAAGDSIQIHGGIGFTWEHDAHLYFRRAKSSEIYLGDAAYHQALVADRLGV